MMNTDILILGSGLSGLSLALKVAKTHRVLIVTKREAIESNTRYAQGGIAAVVADDDDFDSHITDTLRAGAGLCDLKVVENVVCAGPRLIDELISAGVKFSTSSHQKNDLGLEGGHSHRRILHAKDATGLEIEQKLIQQAKKNNKIRFLEHHTAVDLITKKHLKKKTGHNACFGAYVLNNKTGQVLTVRAQTTVLATGGAGKTYLYTSNPDIASGDGIALAHRANCSVANLEFVQFHPTCLYHPKAKSFLISEALRGEGGILRLMNGQAFMHKYHPLKELAPRDIVARAIDSEIKRTGDKHVLLDMTHLDSSFLRKRFPSIYKNCLKFDCNITKEPIPVVPAAHYFCGGVKVDLKGQTDLPKLYAIGEVSCTGLHGANRLASNSLLEALAYADFAARDILNQKKSDNSALPPVKSWDAGSATNSDEAVVITQNWEEIRNLMWNYVGIVRSNKRLLRAQRRIKILLDEIHEYYWDFILTPDLIELRNLGCVADLTIRCALKRKESIGLHYNIDCPVAKEGARFNIIA